MDPFIGELRLLGFGWAPMGWALCEGQLLPIAQYQALFSLLGTTFGGDGRTTFALPDLRGRVVIGTGQAPGLPDYLPGQAGSQVEPDQSTQPGVVRSGYLALAWCIALEGIYPSRP